MARLKGHSSVLASFQARRGESGWIKGREAGTGATRRAKRKLPGDLAVLRLSRIRSRSGFWWGVAPMYSLFTIELVDDSIYIPVASVIKC